MKNVMSIVWTIITMLSVSMIFLGLFKYSHNTPHDTFILIMRVNFLTAFIGGLTLWGLNEDETFK